MDQYVRESWDCGECVLRDSAWDSPAGILLHFYCSDSWINLFSIFLSSAQLHIIYCCVGRRGEYRGASCRHKEKRKKKENTAELMAATIWKLIIFRENVWGWNAVYVSGIIIKKMFLLFLPSLSIPTLRHFMKRQAWQDLRLRFVISHSFVAGQLYSMLPEEHRKEQVSIKKLIKKAFFNKKLF